MMTPIDFYFDFSSPYGYFAAAKIDDLALKYHRTVAWHPILLGAVFKINNQQPLPMIPLKGSYAKHDILRCARWFNLPLKIPTKFPMNTVTPCRAYYWVHDQDAALAKRFALAIYHAYFAEDRDISNAEVVGEVAAQLGIDKAALATALNDTALKERTKNEVDAAIERGVFGSPYVVIDGEPFWGSDRLDQIEAWLAKRRW